MSVLKGSLNRFVNRRDLTSGNTHLLCVPLATTVSRPQLQLSLGALAKDPCAADIPKEAFKWLDNIFLTFGALRLPTSAAVDSAVGLIQKAVDHQSSFFNHKESRQMPEEPLKVSMQGFCDGKFWSRPVKKAALIYLFASIIEPSGRLLRLRHDLYNDLKKAGLWENEEYHQELPEYLLGATIVDASRCKSNKLNDRLSSRIDVNRDRIRRFDATEIRRHYGDYTWTRGFPLERLSIHELGLQHVVRDGILVNQSHREVASIPFSGYTKTIDHQRGCDFYPVLDNESIAPPYVTGYLPSEPGYRDFYMFRGIQK